MPVLTAYPKADIAGDWQLNQPLAIDGTVDLPRVTGVASAGYQGGDLNASETVDGEAEGFSVPSVAAAAEKILLFTWSMDEVAGGVVGTAPTIRGTNEVQTLTSDRTGGTFELEYDGQTTVSSLDAAAATNTEVQTALESLSNIGVGDVTVTGGPLTGTDIVIEFTGALAEAPQVDITVVDSGTGGTAVSVSETIAGVAGNAMTAAFNVNVPHAGGDGETEVHAWTADLVAADLNKPIDFDVADHGALDSWAALAVTMENVNATAVDVSPSAVNGNGSGITWPTITPATVGAVLLAVASWGATGGGLTPASVYPQDPAGFPNIDYAESDAIQAAVWGSGNLGTNPVQPPAISWGPTRDYTGFVFAVRPATPASTAANLYEVVNDGSETDYLELKAAGGAMYEVLEFDLAPLPAGAVITGIRLQVAHLASQSSALRMFPVGISVGDELTTARELSAGYIPSPLAQVQEQTTEEWLELGDGSRWSAHSRIGVALLQATDPISLTTHRVYWVRALISYDLGGPVVSNVAGPATTGDPATWDYSSDEGRPQTNYQVRLMAGLGADPTTATVATDPPAAAAGEIFWDSGKTAGTLERSYSLDSVPLLRGDCTVAVRAWAQLSNGVEVVSDWATANYNITGTEPTVAAQDTDPAFSAGDGSVTVTANPIPVGTSRAWLWRSTDAGTTWELTEGSPYAVTPTGPEALIDTYSPTNETQLQYRITYDTGPASETSSAETMPGGNISTVTSSWYMIDPEGIVPTVQLSHQHEADVLPGFRIVTPTASLVSEQPGNAVVATTDPLATRISMTIRPFSPAGRAAVEAILQSGKPFRLVDVLGRSWLVRNPDGLDQTFLRAGRGPGESTPVGDVHDMPVSLIEVTG